MELTPRLIKTLIAIINVDYDEFNIFSMRLLHTPSGQQKM